MNERDFAYWLQGFFELSETKTLTEKQVTVIKDHLNLVFNKVTPDRSSTASPAGDIDDYVEQVREFSKAAADALEDAKLDKDDPKGANITEREIKHRAILQRYLEDNDSISEEDVKKSLDIVKEEKKKRNALINQIVESSEVAKKTVKDLEKEKKDKEEREAVKEVLKRLREEKEDKRQHPYLQRPQGGYRGVRWPPRFC